jgi:hypothetical protein
MTEYFLLQKIVGKYQDEKFADNFENFENFVNSITSNQQTSYPYTYPLSIIIEIEDFLQVLFKDTKYKFKKLQVAINKKTINFSEYVPIVDLIYNTNSKIIEKKNLFDENFNFSLDESKLDFLMKKHKKKIIITRTGTRTGTYTLKF